MSDLSKNAEAGPSTAKASNGMRPPPPRNTRPSHHPLQSSGPFPSDAAGEYYLDGEMRHNALSIGNPTSEPTFSSKQVVGKASYLATPRVKC
jgi:tyrosyl-DNA phosphodiesterase-1